MSRGLFLESFDRPLQEAPLPDLPPAEPGPSYEDGFRTGYEAGLAEARAEQGRLQAELAEKFAEITFTHAEARAGLMEALRPLFLALSETLLPEAARASLAPYVAEVLFEAAEADSRTAISLLVAPEMVETVRTIAEAQSSNPVVVEANPGLGPGEVLVRNAERETMLDLDRLVTELREALSALFVSPMEEPRHG